MINTVVDMLTEEQKEYIIKELDKKGIGVQTQDYVLHYCEVNAKLYAHVIPIQDIIKRVVVNLDKDIKHYKKLTYSRYNTEDKDIKIALLTRGKIKKNTIFHELDHMATSSKDNLKQANNGKSYSHLECGLDMEMNLNNGEFTSFTGLNEGITEYKVMKYVLYENARKHDVKKYKSDSCYLPYINVVSQLVDMLGEDTIVRDQFYGDIVDLCEKLDEKVQGKYNLFEIVNDMNKSVFLKKSNFFHPIRTIKAKKNLKQKLEISKKITQCTNLGITLSKEEMNVKDLNDILASNRKRTKEHQKIDFIPKVILKGSPLVPKEAYKGRKSLER